MKFARVENVWLEIGGGGVGGEGGGVRKWLYRQGGGGGGGLFVLIGISFLVRCYKTFLIRYLRDAAVSYLVFKQIILLIF